MISEEYYSTNKQAETRKTKLKPGIKSEQLTGDLTSVKESVDDLMKMVSLFY